MGMNWLVVLLVLLKERWSARRDAQNRFLKIQLELLKKRVPGNRVILDPVERRQLMEAGTEVGHEVEDTLEIVSIKTHRNWQRQERAGQEPKKVGRHRVPASLREVILRLARENPAWGVRRIVGELKKLGLKASRSTVRRVPVEEHILPDPSRFAPKGVQTPWRKFLALHMNVLVACDFFAKTIWTPLGKRVAYGLVFIHLATRKVFLSPATYHPNATWVQQQARNVCLWAEEEGIDIRFLIHDLDTKFTEHFDEYFRREDGRALEIPYRAPIANAFCESWISHYKRECLNHFFCFCLGQLDYIGQQYACYYNEYRPHQGLGNEMPAARGHPPAEASEVGIGSIRCRTWLGGLLRHYYREAA